MIADGGEMNLVDADTDMANILEVVTDDCTQLGTGPPVPEVCELGVL